MSPDCITSIPRYSMRISEGFDRQIQMSDKLTDRQTLNECGIIQRSSTRFRPENCRTTRPELNQGTAGPADRAHCSEAAPRNNRGGRPVTPTRQAGTRWCWPARDPRWCLPRVVPAPRGGERHSALQPTGNPRGCSCRILMIAKTRMPAPRGMSSTPTASRPGARAKPVRARIIPSASSRAVGWTTRAVLRSNAAGGGELADAGLSRRRAGRGCGCRDVGGDVAGRDVVLQVGLDRLEAPDDGVEPCDVELLGGIAQLGDRLIGVLRGVDRPNACIVDRDLGSHGRGFGAGGGAGRRGCGDGGRRGRG